MSAFPRVVKRPRAFQADAIFNHNSKAPLISAGGALSSFDTIAQESVDSAVSEGIALHAALMQVLKSKMRCKGGSFMDGCAAVEKATADMYYDLLRAFNRLLPLSNVGSPIEEDVGGQSRYLAFEIQGEEVENRKRRQLELSEELEILRSRGPGEKAKESLLAVLACLGSRKQMCWVETLGDEKPNRGAFAHALAEKDSTIRFACVDTGMHLTPASLLLLEKIPMRDALENFDSDGPLKEIPGKIGAKFQFAFQELVDNDALGSEDGRIVDERIHFRELSANHRLGELIHNDMPVIVVSAFVALAPQEVASAEGLTKIVGAEFEKILIKAKAEGTAVILELGGNNAHMLAKKVYMRPTFSKHGLRCGYIRWRTGPKANWGKEQKADDRCCIALQLP